MQNNKTEPDLSQNFETLVVWDVAYKTTLNKKHKSRKPYQPADSSLLKSFMPGNIQEVFVNVGDKVAKGDKLLVLEAMKMKNVILAPFGGTVKSINVKVGDLVPKNFVLLQLTAE